ncbi:DMT family transporter [Desertibaculum subflavum]|uniref:DMT family transporter n=1 Tax=Desertibaculum subflavum TaxID=2268458 RepID=UPI0013C4EE9C
MVPIAESGASSRWTGILAANAAAFLFGSIALFGKLPLSPVWIVAVRAVFAVLVLALLARLLRNPLVPPTAMLGRIAASGALLAGHWVLFFVSVQLASVAVATLTIASFPLFTIVIEAFWQRRRPRLGELAAGLAIVLAIFLLVGEGAAIDGDAIWGVLAGLAAAATFAVFALASQAMARRIDTVRLSLTQYAAAAAVLMPLLPFAGAPPTGSDWLWLAILGVAGTAVVHQLYLFSLRRLPASVCGAIVSVEPIYAVLLAAALFGEPVGPAIAVSAALVIGATLVLLRR